MLFIGPDNPRKLPLSVGDLDPYLIRGSLGPHESVAKWRLDRFSRFEGLTHMPNRQTDTDRQTTLCACDICSNRPHLCNTCDAA